MGRETQRDLSHITYAIMSRVLADLVKLVRFNTPTAKFSDLGRIQFGCLNLNSLGVSVKHKDSLRNQIRSWMLSPPPKVRICGKVYAYRIEESFGI